MLPPSFGSVERILRRESPGEKAALHVKAMLIGLEKKEEIAMRRTGALCFFSLLGGIIGGAVASNSGSLLAGESKVPEFRELRVDRLHVRVIDVAGQLMIGPLESPSVIAETKAGGGEIGLYHPTRGGAVGSVVSISADSEGVGNIIVYDGKTARIRLGQASVRNMNSGVTTKTPLNAITLWDERGQLVWQAPPE
jgi:hypothetical protein